MNFAEILCLCYKISVKSWFSSDFLTWKVTPRQCKMMRNLNCSRPRRNHHLPCYGSSCDETFWNGFGQPSPQVFKIWKARLPHIHQTFFLDVPKYFELVQRIEKLSPNSGKNRNFWNYVLFRIKFQLR